MKNRLSVLALALAAVFPLAQTAHAQSTAELKAEIEALKQQLLLLSQKVEAASAAAAAQPAVDPQEFNRIKVKAEAVEDHIESIGLKNLKISGVMDPTFMYNNRQDHAGFVFLNNFDYRSAEESYAFDNSYFGMAVLDVQKETDGGNKWRLTLAPHKSAGSGYNLGSIVHEASVSVPLTDPATRMIAGMIPDWSGYEYIMANQQPLISHNLLFDFSIPTLYSGVGLELSRGKWIMKGMLANINQIRKGNGDKTPGLTYRVDYSKGEYDGFGFAGTHSFSTGNKFDLFEVDGYFIRGDVTVQGQIGFGRKPSASATGGTAQWWGASGLFGYKLSPRLQAVARADYIANRNNGGGVFGSVSSGCLDATGADDYANDCANAVVALGDYRNGFGPTFQDAVDYATGVTSSLRGVNRYALTTGLNYLFNPTTSFKLEARYDAASGPVFFNVKDGSFKKNSTTLGTSVVVQF